jgi:hypothetical protein
MNPLIVGLVSAVTSLAPAADAANPPTELPTGEPTHRGYDVLRGTLAAAPTIVPLGAAAASVLYLLGRYLMSFRRRRPAQVHDSPGEVIRR